MKSSQEVAALFLLAGFAVLSIEQIENQYWPPVADYDQVRKENPWWRVQVSHGQITIGPRKRVFAIDWEDIGVVDAEQLTTDDVTKFSQVIHAWTLPKALEYLTTLRHRLDEAQPKTSSSLSAEGGAS